MSGAREPTESEPIVVGDRGVSLEQLAHFEEILRRSPSNADTSETEIKQRVAIFFIDYLWITGEAERQGFEVTDADVDARIAEVRRERYPDDVDFSAFLSESGQTLDDLRLRVQIELYSSQLKELATAGARSKRAWRKRLDDYRRRHDAYWSARTRCLDPYYVEMRCRG